MNKIKKYLNHTSLITACLVVNSSLLQAAEVNYAEVIGTDGYIPTPILDGVLVAVPTPPLQGHAPGIETFITLRNHPQKDSTNNQLTLCDAVKVNYRVLDIEGDAANNEKIIESISWFVKFTDGDGIEKKLYIKHLNYDAEINEDKLDGNSFSDVYRDHEEAKYSLGENWEPEELFADKLKHKLTLILYPQLELYEKTTDGKFVQYKEPYLGTLVKKDTNRKILFGYEIIPFTSTGDDSYSIEKGYDYGSKKWDTLGPNKNLYLNVESNKLVKVLPRDGIGKEDGFFKDELGLKEATGFFEIPENIILGNNYKIISSSDSENKVYLSDSVGYSCGPNFSKPDETGFSITYSVIRDDLGDGMDFPTTDEFTPGYQYKVRFYKVTKNEDEQGFANIYDEITYELTSKKGEEYLAKDSYGKKFVEGLRLDLMMMDFDELSDTKRVIEDISIFDEPTVTGNDVLSISSTGIPLYNIYKGSANDLIYENGIPIFQIKENGNNGNNDIIFTLEDGIKIPKFILNNSSLARDYFNGNDSNDTENAITLQSFIVNVKSFIPLCLIDRPEGMSETILPICSKVTKSIINEEQ